MRKSRFSEQQIIAILALHPAWQADPECVRGDFIGRLRDELLNETSFGSLSHARDLLAEWRDDFNQSRPHTSLKG